MSLELPPFNFNFSPQKGKPGHCMVAQVWDERGNTLAEIEPSADPAYATMIARLFAKSPLLVRLLEQALDLCPEPELSKDYRLSLLLREEARELIAELRRTP